METPWNSNEMYHGQYKFRFGVCFDPPSVLRPPKVAEARKCGHGSVGSRRLTSWDASSGQKTNHPGVSCMMLYVGFFAALLVACFDICCTILVIQKESERPVVQVGTQVFLGWMPQKLVKIGQLHRKMPAQWLCDYVSGTLGAYGRGRVGKRSPTTWNSGAVPD